MRSLGGGVVAVTPRAILLRAAALLEPPGRWVQNEWGIDADGEGTFSPRDAVCYCASMALVVAARGHGQRALRGAQRALAALVVVADDGVSDEVNIQLWNDAEERSQAEVVAALRQAAEVLP